MSNPFDIPIPQGFNPNPRPYEPLRRQFNPQYDAQAFHPAPPVPNFGINPINLYNYPPGSIPNLQAAIRAAPAELAFIEGFSNNIDWYQQRFPQNPNVNQGGDNNPRHHHHHDGNEGGVGFGQRDGDPNPTPQGYERVQQRRLEEEGEEELVLPVNVMAEAGYPSERVDGVFEGTVGDLFQCGICLEILRDTTEVGCEQGHVFCYQCIINSDVTRCPFCREDVSDQLLKPVKAMDRLIKGLKWKCAYFQAGCNWKGSLDSHDETHEPKCLYRPLSCPNAHRGCPSLVPIVNGNENQDRAIRGEEALRKHLEIDCSWELVICPIGGEMCGEYERRNIEEHNRLCNWQRCPYFVIDGCTFVAPLDSPKLFLHQKYCRGVHKELDELRRIVERAGNEAIMKEERRKEMLLMEKERKMMKEENKRREMTMKIKKEEELVMRMDTDELEAGEKKKIKEMEKKQIKLVKKDDKKKKKTNIWCVIGKGKGNRNRNGNGKEMEMEEEQEEKEGKGKRKAIIVDDEEDDDQNSSIFGLNSKPFDSSPIIKSERSDFTTLFTGSAPPITTTTTTPTNPSTSAIATSAFESGIRRFNSSASLAGATHVGVTEGSQPSSSRVIIMNNPNPATPSSESSNPLSRRPSKRNRLNDLI